MPWVAFPGAQGDRTDAPPSIGSVDFCRTSWEVQRRLYTVTTPSSNVRGVASCEHVRMCSLRLLLVLHMISKFYTSIPLERHDCLTASLIHSLMK